MLHLQYVNITYYVILTYPFLLCSYIYITKHTKIAHLGSQYFVTNKVWFYYAARFLLYILSKICKTWNTLINTRLIVAFLVISFFTKCIKLIHRLCIYYNKVRQYLRMLFVRDNFCWIPVVGMVNVHNLYNVTGFAKKVPFSQIKINVIYFLTLKFHNFFLMKIYVIRLRKIGLNVTLKYTELLWHK